MKPKSFKIGDRVKLRGAQHKGTVTDVCNAAYKVLLDKGTSSWHGRLGLTRLIKKKKPLGVKEYEQISERMIGRIKSVAVTRQQLAKAWDRFVWGNHHTHAAESILFEAFCKEIGLA